MCALIEAGEHCPEGDKCPYAHAITELRATPMLYKTVLCSWWKKGQCEFGDSCRFAHGDDQLREGSPLPSPTKNGGLSASSSVPHSLNTLMSTTASVASPTAAQRTKSLTDFVAPSPMYAMVFGAALSAATNAAVHNGVSVLSPQQAAAVAAAAAAAASEVMRQFQTSSTTQLEPVAEGQNQVSLREEIQKLKKGFASSPALLGFFEGNDDQPILTEWIPTQEDEVQDVIRPRSDSDPGLKATERLMEEIRKLWTDEQQQPTLGQSASHSTLDGYHVNLD
jgi:hypothetical protein